MLKIVKNQFGLTLVETTVALGILMIGILACLILMLSTFNFVHKNEQEVVTVNLAREGIEIVRALRNIENEDFDFFSYEGKFIVDNKDLFNLDYAITDGDIGDIDDCNGINECQLYLKNGRYLHDASGTVTPFKRIIKIINVGDDERQIISEVTWEIKGQVHSFLLETNLTNWTELESVKIFNE